jgi:hypothetical protein
MVTLIALGSATCIYKKIPPTDHVGGVFGSALRRVDWDMARAGGFDYVLTTIVISIL